MRSLTLMDLVKTALPQEFDAAILEASAPAERWQIDPNQALAYALRNCPLLDWDVYLSRNPDLVEQEIDPIEHFLKHGVFEGRKLEVASYLSGQKSPKEIRPKVSVIIPNHNKAQYLRKSVGSVIDQTLVNIEIIIVDDASDDGSMAILQELAAQDARIKLIAFDARRFTHMARKEGVLASTGRAVMFLDSDDYYLPYACEVAYDALTKGYDFVAFNSRVVPNPASDPIQDKQQAAYLISGAPRDYNGWQIINSFYENRHLPRNLWNKIYEGEHCRRCFHAMPDGSFAQSEDVLEALTLITTAKRAAKIDNALYVYRTNVGVSTADMSTAKTLMLADTGEILKPLKEFLDRQGLAYLYDKLSYNFMTLPRTQFLEYAPPDLVTMFFNKLAGYRGIEQLITDFAKLGDKAWSQAANQFQYYHIDKKVGAPKKIGVLYRRLGLGGAEKVAGDQIRLLYERGYEISVFLESAEAADLDIPTDIKIYYFGKNPETPEELRANLRALDRAILQSGVELMLIHVTYIKTLLWLLMLIRGRQIPTILFSHEDFYFPLLHPWTKGVNDRRLAALKCGDKVVALSKYNELYLRNRGVDAQYIPNPVRLPDANERINLDFEARRKNIIVFCRLGDETKNVGDCLRVLHEIVTEHPDVKLTFVGSFDDDKVAKKFYDLVMELKLRDHIHVTGWLQDARSFIDQAGVLLSCAYHEAFPLSISETQARGLPCVMYDLPIMIAEDNPSIIRVPTGNYQAVAREIVKLMESPERWRELAEFALGNARRFSGEAYAQRVTNLINSFDRETPTTYYKPEDYRVVIRHLAFYGAHLPPWIKKI